MQKTPVINANVICHEYSWVIPGIFHLPHTQTNTNTNTTTFTNILSNLYQASLWDPQIFTSSCSNNNFPQKRSATLAEKKRHRPKGCETKGMSAAHQQKGSAGQGDVYLRPRVLQAMKDQSHWCTPGRPKKNTATKTNSILTPWAYPSKLGTPGPTCRNDGIYINNSMHAGHRAQKGLYKTCKPVTTTTCLHWDDANCETRSKKSGQWAWDPKISTFWMPKLWTDNISRGSILLFERVLESSFLASSMLQNNVYMISGTSFPSCKALMQ